MLEEYGNIWTYHKRGVPIVITTNGSIKKDGKSVMGRGVAWQAQSKYPEFPDKLGEKIKAYGNDVFYFHEYNIFTFPVKEDWLKPASLLLVERSCKQLMDLVENLKMPRVVIVRPGCRNGLLKWENVKPICQRYFDDRILIVDVNG